MTAGELVICVRAYSPLALPASGDGASDIANALTNSGSADASPGTLDSTTSSLQSNVQVSSL